MYLDGVAVLTRFSPPPRTITTRVCLIGMSSPLFLMGPSTDWHHKDHYIASFLPLKSPSIVVWPNRLPRAVVAWHKRKPLLDGIGSGMHAAYDISHTWYIRTA